MGRATERISIAEGHEMATRACSRWWTRAIGLILCTTATPLDADAQGLRGDDRPASLWQLEFVDKAELPPSFRQFKLARPDGTRQTAFLATFDPDLEQRKPLMIYFDGSGAGSHFARIGERIGMTTSGLLAKVANERFHVAMSEKRGVEFLAHGGGSGENVSAEYTEHATYGGRLAEGHLLLDALLKQSAVDPGRVVLVGHSEGADVAAAIAALDPRVTHVAFLAGGGPTQMFDLIVLERKRRAARGDSPEEIERAVEALERDYRAIFADPESTTKMFQGHAYRRWSSFFKHPPAENLLKSRARLFIAQGSADQSVPIESLDYLAVELIRAQRPHTTIRRYAGRDHGFQDPSSAASEGPAIEAVLRDVVDWALAE